jgi:hypothetical protein
MTAKTITNISINNAHYKLDVVDIAGAQLKELGGIPAANLLFREVHGHGEDEQIADSSVIHLHDGDRFYDMPPGNFGNI